MFKRPRRTGTVRDQGLKRAQPDFRARPQGAMVCMECRAVCHAGRWYWGAPPRTQVRFSRCPACSRIREERPAGTLRLPRAFFPADPEEVFRLVRRLVRHAEEEEKEEHPLERVMKVVADREGLTVTTTGVYLAGVITGELERRLRRRPRVCHRESEGVCVEWHA